MCECLPHPITSNSPHNPRNKNATLSLLICCWYVCAFCTLIRIGNFSTEPRETWDIFWQAGAGQRHDESIYLSNLFSPPPLDFVKHDSAPLIITGQGRTGLFFRTGRGRQGRLFFCRLGNTSLDRCTRLTDFIQGVRLGLVDSKSMSELTTLTIVCLIIILRQGFS